MWRISNCAAGEEKITLKIQSKWCYVSHCWIRVDFLTCRRAKCRPSARTRQWTEWYTRTKSGVFITSVHLSQPRVLVRKSSQLPFWHTHVGTYTHPHLLSSLINTILFLLCFPLLSGLCSSSLLLQRVARGKQLVRAPPVWSMTWFLQQLSYARKEPCLPFHD